jgi:hypothetical protein
MKQRETSADPKHWLIQLLLSFPCAFFLYHGPLHNFQCCGSGFSESGSSISSESRSISRIWMSKKFEKKNLRRKILSFFE